MRNWFKLGEKESTDFGVYISGGGTWNSPEREIDLISLNGRDGDLVGLSTRLQNMEVTYPAFICRDFACSLAALRAYLLCTPAYRRLWDTYHPDEYRLATYMGGLEAEVSGVGRAGRFDLTFNVKPQRYLIKGERTQLFDASGTIKNPTLFPAQPLLRVYGTGELGIGGETVTIQPPETAGDQTVTDIDCEAMEAWRGTTSCNDKISFSGLDFPALPPGESAVNLGAGITRVEITPRWWTV